MNARIAWVLIVGVVFCGQRALSQPAAPPAVDPNAVIAEINQKLASADPAAQKAGVGAIQKLLETDPPRALTNLRSTWLKGMMDAKRYDDVEDLSLRALLASSSEVATVEFLQQARIRAMLNGGKAEQALMAAKGLYNVCGMVSTAAAMLTVAECLNAAHPGDYTFTDRFRIQQQGGCKSTNNSPGDDGGSGGGSLGAGGDQDGWQGI